MVHTAIWQDAKCIKAAPPVMVGVERVGYHTMPQSRYGLAGD